MSVNRIVVIFTITIGLFLLMSTLVPAASHQDQKKKKTKQIATEEETENLLPSDHVYSNSKEWLKPQIQQSDYEILERLARAIELYNLIYPDQDLEPESKFTSFRRGYITGPQSTNTMKSDIVEKLFLNMLKYEKTFAKKTKDFINAVDNAIDSATTCGGVPDIEKYEYCKAFAELYVVQMVDMKVFRVTPECREKRIEFYHEEPDYTVYRMMWSCYLKNNKKGIARWWFTHGNGPEDVFVAEELNPSDDRTTDNSDKKKSVDSSTIGGGRKQSDNELIRRKIAKDERRPDKERNGRPAIIINEGSSSRHGEVTHDVDNPVKLIIHIELDIAK